MSKDRADATGHLLTCQKLRTCDTHRKPSPYPILRTCTIGQKHCQSIWRSVGTGAPPPQLCALLTLNITAYRPLIKTSNLGKTAPIRPWNSRAQHKHTTCQGLGKRPCMKTRRQGTYDKRGRPRPVPCLFSALFDHCRHEGQAQVEIISLRQDLGQARTTLHMNTSMGRMLDSFRSTLPFPVVRLVSPSA